MAPNIPVCFIGLGALGHPMAANLLAAGVPLTVHNHAALSASSLCKQLVPASLAAQRRQRLQPRSMRSASPMPRLLRLFCADPLGSWQGLGLAA